MDVVSLYLIATAAVLLLGVLGEVVFHRTGIPQPLWLIACGLLLGPVLGVAPREQMAQLAPYVALPALVMVITELGGRLRFESVARGLSRTGPLAGLSFVGSVLIVTLVSLLAQLTGLLPDDWGWSQSLLLGLTLGAACSLITTPAMLRSRLAPHIVQSLELESALTGAASVVAVALFVAVLDPDAAGFVESLVNLLIAMSLGLGLGLLGAALWFGFLFALQAPSYGYTATLAALLVLYAVTEQLGGSGPLAVLTSAVLLANAPSIGKRLRIRRPVEIGKDARGYRRLLMFVVRSSFFLYVGLLLGPPWGLVGFGVLIALLLFPARLPAVLVATKWGGWSPDTRPLSAISMPRGMLAGVLALLPLQAAIGGAAAFPLTVFSVVVVTSTVYAVGFPFVRRKLPAADIVAFDVDEELGASPVSLVTPDETSRRALMPSSTDEVVPPTSRSPHPSSANEGQLGPLPPPTPPPRRDSKT